MVAQERAQLAFCIQQFQTLGMTHITKLRVMMGNAMARQIACRNRFEHDLLNLGFLGHFK
ncbi:hypothetical protein BBI09_05670 [Stutzerimonas xanthomarina]|nr:hypothetical protein BBI09_05670 [Stutzerimonas xanthomarina]